MIKMKKQILIFFVILQSVIVNAQLAGTYEIGATQTPPFNTVKSAVNELNTVGISGAVTFLLTDPLYEESGIELKNIQGTSTANTITMRPANGVNAEIKGNGEYILGIGNCSHIYFEGKSPNNTGSLTITSTETDITNSVIEAVEILFTNNQTYNIHVNNCNINASQPFFLMINILTA